MSVLAVLIPPRQRDADAAAATSRSDWAWVLSVDGRSVARQGQGAPASWPAADEVVAVLAEADVAWLPATLPRAPASRLPQALLGLLEDQLLDDDVHFAVAPGSSAGQATWVAVVDRPWLSAALQALDTAGRPAVRAVPLLQPAASPPRGHFLPGRDDAERLHLAWSDARGAAWLSLDGTLARGLAATAGAQWTAAPACAGAAEAWLGHPVAALGDGERVLQAVAGGWNLRQFGLAPRHRGAGRLKDGWRRFLMPAWRPVHIGLLGLLAVNLVGLNAWAWQQQRALGERRQAMVGLLREAHPQVRAVLDAPLQMKRETDRLRAAAGQPGDDDLETLLGVAAAAWPDDEPPVAALQFEPGRLVLDIDGWDEVRIAEFRDLVQPAGWQVSTEGTQLTLRRAPEGVSR
ncbi:type II secretion system protein GspL [Rubrivivax albus]|uniref:General secretion pathway protein GspL n=1 Tax=Rubrivivax albus TaxID=2499835 RepID=A0A3S2UAE3_9BURK|nr:type II secretion system protein GspL [Rubrivivax albus]RVT53398.1 general secretion pathway protein GspL [Rubrivivax albus]